MGIRSAGCQLRAVSAERGAALRRVLLVLLMSAGAVGCRAWDSTNDTRGFLRVVDVNGPRYGGDEELPLETVCRNWRLSDHEVATFFLLSEQYEESPYSSFYQVPCSISGALEADGKAWDFVIGGGGTATWSDGNETRYFGCSAQACEPLVLMPTDLMDPE